MKAIAQLSSEAKYCYSTALFNRFIKFGELILSRYYNIIYEAKILIRINEVFPISSFH
ncbi:MAG: DUF98 domain-containing protein [archaeon]|nr:DUF98 domain-containing protein [archaeon]